MKLSMNEIFDYGDGKFCKKIYLNQNNPKNQLNRPNKQQKSVKINLLKIKPLKRLKNHHTFLKPSRKHFDEFSTFKIDFKN